MQFKEASAKLESILNDKEITLSEINRFICDLFSDKDLSKAELNILLLKTSSKGIDLGRLIFSFKMSNIWTNKDSAAKNYLKLIKKAQTPITLFTQDHSSSHDTMPSFAQLIARHGDNDVIQDFLQILKNLYYSFNDTSTSNILLILNQKRQSKSVSSSRLPIETYHSFFEEIANRHLPINMFPIIEIITASLRRNEIQFEEINNYPKRFINAVYEQDVAPLRYNATITRKISQWLALFPTCYYPTNFKLLAFACDWCERLSRTLSPLGDQTLIIDQNTTAAELSLLSACVDLGNSHQPACNSPERLKTIRIVDKLKHSSLTPIDDKLIANLAVIFKYVRTLEFTHCEMNPTFRILLAAARMRAQTMPGYSYHVRTIKISDASIDKLIFDENTSNYSANGFPVGDTNVEELEISNTEMVHEIFKEEVFLKFLTSMTKLTTLRLANLRFYNKSTQLSAIDQAMRKSGLTSLTLDFPLEDADLIHIIKLLNYNQSLIELILPQGRFNEATLVKLAETLRTSNRTLHTLTLAKETVIPKLLVDALRNNKEDEINTKKQRDIQNTIDCVNRFLSPTNDITQRDAILNLWNNVAWSCNDISEIMKKEIPPSVRTMTLCGNLAMSGSQLLLKIMPLLMNYPAYQYMDKIIALGGLFRYISDPAVKLEFAKNMHAICSRFYDNIITKFNGVMQDNYLHGCEKFAPVMTYAHLASDISSLIFVLRCFPAEQNLFYREINNMLFELFKRKILGTLYDTTNEDMIALTKKIKDEELTKEISDLFAHLHNFLDTVGDVEQLRVQFRDAIEGAKRVLFGNNYSSDTRTLYIEKIRLLRGEVQQICNARTIVALSPPPSFIPGKDIAKQFNDVDTNKVAASQSAATADQAPLPRSAEVDVDEDAPSLSFKHAVKPSAVAAALPLTAVGYPVNTSHLPAIAADNSSTRPSNLSASTAIKSSASDALIPPYAAKPSATQDSALMSGTLLAAGSTARPTVESSAGSPSTSISGSITESTHKLNPFNSDHSIPVQLPGVTPQTPSSTAQLLPPPLLPQAASSLSSPPLHIRGLSLLAPSSTSTTVPPPPIPDANAITHTDREATNVQRLFPNIYLHSTAQSEYINSIFSDADTLTTIERNLAPPDVVDEQLPISAPEEPETPAAESGSFIRSGLRFMTFSSDTADLLKPPAPEAEDDLKLPSVPNDLPQVETASQIESSDNNSADSQKRKTISRPLAG